MRWLIFLLLFITPSLQALPQCQMEGVEWLERRPWTSCVSSEISAVGGGDSHRKEKPGFAGYTGEIYGSAAWGHVLSFHIKGAAKNLAEPEHEQNETYQATQLAFLQAGHPLVDPIYASVGKIDAPFGLNHDLYRLILPSRARDFWLRSEKGVRATGNWEGGLHLELGTTQEALPDGLLRDMISARILQTIDLLNGAKVIGSYAYSTNYAARRIGFATLVRNAENLTSIEWVRKSENFDQSRYEQIFRIVHEQHETNWSWNIVIEEMRKNSYRLGFGARKPWTKYCNTSVSAHFQRDVTEGWHSHWILLLAQNFGAAYTWEEAEF